MDINLKPVSDGVQVSLNQAVRETGHARFSLLLSLIKTNYQTATAAIEANVQENAPSESTQQASNFSTWNPGINSSLHNKDMATFNLLKSFGSADHVSSIMSSVISAPTPNPNEFLSLLEDSREAVI